MPIETPATAKLAQDDFEAYYAEKLWQWIPGFYREEDASTNTPGTLRALVESMAVEAATLRRTLDRVWENHFVELADDDALERIGALLATRMVHAENRRGRRVDVAKTIYYRRRKGTPRVLESLITDITGWGGAHLDTRLRLARSWHLLEPAPERGRFTLTPRGGVADLRSPRIPELAYTAYEELGHSPDLRRYDGGTRGRYGIAKIGVHVHRDRAFELATPTMKLIDADATYNYWTLDPSGRDAPLYQPLDRPSGETWFKPREWQMPAPMRCRVLAHAEFEWSDQVIEDMGLTDATELLQSYSDQRFRSELELRRLVESFPAGLAKTEILTVMLTLLADSLVADTGWAQLYGGDASGNQALTLGLGATTAGTELALGEILVANLKAWGTTLDGSLYDSDKRLIVDPERGRARTALADTPYAPVLHHGAARGIGAGAYDRRASLVTESVAVLSDGGTAHGPVALGAGGVTGVEEIPTSKTYTAGDFLDVEDYTLQAANLTRPYVLRSPASLTWTFDAADSGEPCLVLDGLWLGCEDPAPTLNDPPPEAKLLFTGTWKRVVIRNCTLDPGGKQAADLSGDFVAIPYLQLEVTGQIEELIIENSITGPIVENTGGGDPCSVGTIHIRDSIVSGQNHTTGVGLSTKLAEVHLERSTVLGSVDVNRLYASDSLVGPIDVTDLQNGCFRFSASMPGDAPRAFESHVYPSISADWFGSLVFGEAGFGRLTAFAPEEVRSGAENRGPMGAFNRLIDSIKREDFERKFEEFVPFGLIPQVDLES